MAKTEKKTSGTKKAVARKSAGKSVATKKVAGSALTGRARKRERKSAETTLSLSVRTAQPLAKTNISAKHVRRAVHSYMAKLK